MTKSKPTSIHRMREIVRVLNRLYLNRADYHHIKRLIKELIQRVRFHAFTTFPGAEFYRGRISSEKLRTVGEFSAPPASMVSSFQRCNPPQQPMFYAAAGIPPVFFELPVSPGDTVFLSKWTLMEEIPVVPISPDKIHHNDPRSNLVSSYFETVFSQPIHEVYSKQYKVTAAIADALTEKGFLAEDVAKNPAYGRKVSLSYPSVHFSSRADCIAFLPSVAESCLRLDYVEEVYVNDVRDQTIKIESKDVASDFVDDEVNWTGKAMHWNIGPGQNVSVTVEANGYVVRDSEGNIINPGNNTSRPNELADRFSLSLLM